MKESDQVQIQINEARRMQELRDNCGKLLKNTAFKKVIEEGYFKEEAARLVMAKSNHNLSPDQQVNIDNMIYGVGTLANYLESVMRRGAEMDTAIEEYEETQTELLSEELSNAK